MPYYNVERFKNSNFWKFWAINRIWPHWINFTILTFTSENNRLKAYNKICNEIISFDMKKKVKCKICHGKIEEKTKFGNLYNESLRFKCGIPIMFGPRQLYF
jgi:hypothetical protein